MSWLFSQALAEESLGATSSVGEPFAQLNVMPTAQPFWRNDKTMEPSRLSRFGLTSRLLAEPFGKDVLMSFLEDFPVRTSPAPAAVTDLTESDPGFGFRWPGSFAKFDPHTFSWRTRQCSLLGGLDEFSETWPRYGWMRDGECIPLPMLELTTSANESGLWQTPVADDSVNRANGKWNSRGEPKLSAQVMIPTPTVCGNYNRVGDSATSGDGLATWVAKYPTICARDYRGVHRAERGLERRQESKRGIPLNEHCGGLLNPPWVEWLMGWPIGWTELKPLETAKFHEWQQQHGESSMDNGAAA